MELYFVGENAHQLLSTYNFSAVTSYNLIGRLGGEMTIGTRPV